MYFDFDDRFADIAPVGSAINRRDGVFLAVLAHVALVLVVLFAPRVPAFEGEPAPLADVTPPEERETPRFVFVQPRVDLEVPQPRARTEDSDKNRVARSLERPSLPSNDLPAARGTSPERVEAPPEERSAGRGPGTDPSREAPRAEAVESPPTPSVESPTAASPSPTPPVAAPQGGSLGEALKNLQRYVDKESFGNLKGNVQDLGPLQFDTKGVEFGPWIRRFIAQVRRNWFVPYAAMTMRGRVVLQFNVHKDGRITGLAVVKPSEIGSFNSSAFNALSGSNPTEPLPSAYPDDKAFFTVTFYYNESPDATPRQ